MQQLQIIYSSTSLFHSWSMVVLLSTVIIMVVSLLSSVITTRGIRITYWRASKVNGIMWLNVRGTGEALIQPSYTCYGILNFIQVLIRGKHCIVLSL